MTDKQIIIDGVDVSGCRFLDDCSKSMCNDFRGDNSGFHQPHCIQNPNCYYKQLRRKEQELERLKRDYFKQNDWLQQRAQECEELKENNQDLTILSMDLDIAHRTVLNEFTRTNKSRDLWREKADRYKQALEKIEEHFEHRCNLCREEYGLGPDCSVCWKRDIKNIINEVNDEKH